MSVRKLRAWEGAGLIDAATAARIRAWEAEHARPLGLWAVIGIAALSIGLGLISVVAANWDAIPGTVRLALHFALMAGLALFLGLRGQVLAERQPWLHEAALFVLGILGLTFVGHVGQVYQTSSPLWQPLLLWLALFAPLFLLRGQSWLSALMLMTVLPVAAWNYAVGVDRYGISDTGKAIRIALATGTPVLVAGVAPWLRDRSIRVVFWKRLAQLAFTYAVAGTSLFAIVSAFDDLTDSDDVREVMTGVAIYAALVLAAAVLVYRNRTESAAGSQAAILAGAAVVLLLAVPLSGSQFLAGALFIAFWAGIAAASLFAGWRAVFQVAVAAIALRLIVLSFELASNLLTSGAGLIISGLLILAVALVAVQITKRFAPARHPLPDGGA